MIKVCVLGSGSKGNATYFEVDGSSFLVDCGFSKNVIRKKLKDIGKDLNKIDGVFVTHRHGDHLAPWVDNEIMVRFPETYKKGVVVKSFDLSHDEPCVGYIIKDKDGNKVAIISDTGCISEEALGHLFDCTAILIECGYDVDMLVNGTYETELQERIASDVGHLLNEDAAAVIKMVDWPGLKYVVGLHLSEHNNNPALVRFCLESVTGAEVVIAGQYENSKMMVMI